MTEPKIAKKSPITFYLESGTYYWCQCGRSNNQPFCDQTHKSTEFLPVKFKIDKKKQVTLCQCKKTCTAPFCDNSHTKIVDKVIWPKF